MKKKKKNKDPYQKQRKLIPRIKKKQMLMNMMLMFKERKYSIYRARD